MGEKKRGWYKYTNYDDKEFDELELDDEDKPKIAA